MHAELRAFVAARQAAVRRAGFAVASVELENISGRGGENGNGNVFEAEFGGTEGRREFAQLVERAESIAAPPIKAAG